jgi:chromosomal replication initiator protein
MFTSTDVVRTPRSRALRGVVTCSLLIGTGAACVRQAQQGTGAPMMQRDAAETWVAALGQLQLQVTRANYDTWLRDTVGMRFEDDKLIIGAPNDFATEWLATRMRVGILRAVAGVVGRKVEVDFEVAGVEEDDEPALLATQDDSPVPPMFRKRGTPPALNPAFTFDSFVVADENRMAHEAARRAVSDPGQISPLLLFGASGLGKTHLLNAIGHEAYASGRSVVYAPAERFANDYVKAVQSGDYERFHQRYRRCELLLLDDIQFLEDSEKFQKQFLHAFNELQTSGHHIVVTCDKAPQQMMKLIEPLRSRLSSGLMADLQKPGRETRLEILRAKVRRHARPLPEEALAAIADRYCPSVRDLEGYLNRVIAFAPLVDEPVTPQLVERALSPLAKPAAEPSPPTAAQIVDAVCARTHLAPADLRGRSRARNVSYARHLAMYVMKEDGRCTIAEIGRELGHRDHSTVLAGISRITKDLSNYADTRDDLTAVREALASDSESAAASG